MQRNHGSADARGERPRRGGMRPLTAIVIALLGAAVALLLLNQLKVIDLFPSRTEPVVSDTTVTFTLRDIGELATQEALMTRVHSFSDSRELFGITIPGTERRLLFSYDITVKAGLDFSEVQVTADTAAKTVRVTLPAARILDVTIDQESFRVYDETDNIFNALRSSDYNDAIGTMMQEGREYAEAHDILGHARRNAELLIRGFLAASYPAPEYTYSFHWAQ